MAVLKTPDEGPEPGMFVVITRTHVTTDEAYISQLRTSLQRLPVALEIQYIRPLTRRLQRLFRWG